MALVFINHRKADTHEAAARLRGDLERAFPDDEVFLDDKDLIGGDDWPEVLRQKVSSADVFIALIGKDWRFIQDPDSGRRRLDEADDWVRLEIEWALARKERDKLRVIPLLVDGAEVPVKKYLPDKIRDLSRCQGLRLRTRDWETDVAALGRVLRAQGFAVSDRAAENSVGGQLRRPTPLDALRTNQSMRLRAIDAESFWRQDLYTQLDAEVVEDAPQRRTLGRLFQRRSHSVREPVDALRESDEVLTLLEGAPGTGKSVTLRRLATALLDGTSGNETTTRIPLYVDLKSLSGQPPLEDVDAIAQAIRDHIVEASLDHATGMEFKERFRALFDDRLFQGGWHVLLDSFDEIPALLSSHSPDVAVKAYAKAIQGLASANHRSRFVVASRIYNSPDVMGWRKITLRPLTGEQQLRLVERQLGDHQRAIHAKRAFREVPGLHRDMTNPLFLSLLCDFYEQKEQAPSSLHEAFEAFTAVRLSKDAARLKAMNVSSETLRRRAEAIAYRLNADPGLGLSPPRGALEGAILPELGLDERKRTLDALLACGLAHQPRRSDASARQGELLFEFSHRRVQEYLATSYVLEHPEVVSTQRLLTDARWRETAVTLLQAGSDRAHDVLAVAFGLADGWADALELPECDTAVEPGGADEVARTAFPWPADCLHVLGILVERPVSDETDSPGVDRLLCAAERSGLRSDQRLALAVASAASPTVFERLLERGFASGSRYLADVCYLGAARLRRVSDSIADGMRESLVWQALSGELGQNALETEVHVRRAEPGLALVQSLKLLRWARWVDVGLLLLAGIASMLLLSPDSGGEVLAYLALLIVVVGGFTWVSPRLARWSVASSSATGLMAWAPFYTSSMWLRMMFGLVLPTGFVLESVSFDGLAFTMALVIWLVASSWWPAAMSAARLGAFAQARWWPLLSFWPVLWYFRLFVEDRRRWARATAVVAVTVGSAVLGTYLVTLLDESAVSAPVWLGLVLFVPPGIAGIGAFIVVVWDWLLDRGLSRRIRQLGTLPPDQFLDRLCSFRTPAARTDFVRWVADERRLESHVDSASIVEGLEEAILRASATKAGRKVDLPAAENWPRPFKEWYDRRCGKRRLQLSGWRGDLLDQVARLKLQAQERIEP